jgi:hypothetical protein
MKDWRKLFDDQSPTISYDPEGLLEKIRPGYGSDSEGPSDDDYELIRTHLQSLADSGLVSVELEEPEDEGRAAGGGEEYLWLVVIGTAAAIVGAYPGAKELTKDLSAALKRLAADFRAILDRLRSGGTEWISAHEKMAIVCAWAYVLDVGEDVSFEYIGRLERANPDGWTVFVGWLVAFTVDGQLVSVTVSMQGEVIETVRAPDVAAIHRLVHGSEE